MKRFDTFPYSGEADMLECRLVELADVGDLVHVLVEADVTHAGDPKPYTCDTHEFGARFDQWGARLRVVKATDLPTTPDTWDREHAQREALRPFLDEHAAPDDIIFHGDVDEIPTALAVRFARPNGTAVFHQRFHPFAVDWRHPRMWPGTTVAAFRNVTTLSSLRDARSNKASTIVPDAGWHLSWVGDESARVRKMDSFCHQEIKSTWKPHLEDCYASGLHVDGTPLEPVDVVEGEWPQWVTYSAPASWFRPTVTKSRPDVKRVPIVKSFYESQP